jgi:hypothetical protein
MKTAALIFLALLPFSLSAQGVRIGPNPAPADSSAGLDVDFTDRGLLPPRMTSQQRNAIVNPAAGLLVYNTSTQCLELHLPQGGWQAVLCDCQNPPNPSISVNNTSAGTNVSVPFAAAQPGTIASYSWSFQGGTPATSSSSNPSVTWSQAGTYWVYLTAYNSIGCSETDSLQMTVSAGVTVNTYNYFQSGQEYLLRGSQYGIALSDQQTADCFCQAIGFNSAQSFQIAYPSTFSCFGYNTNCAYQSIWCSGTTNRHVITTVTCQ